ncbi:MAG TPA: presenilin family intramembrane aspartyl protease PSH [Candidatus Thermoplasmatota archaeon]|nr:presenilin family intramembrane aspartyl protease PSH [Candidatus Thermoplasmatota archaeon]
MSEPAQAPERPPPTPTRKDYFAVLAMAVLFLLSIGLAMAVAPTYDAQGLYAFPEEERESVANPLIYLGIVVAFTLVILLIAKLKLKRLIQYIILGAVFMTIFITTFPLFVEIAPGVNPDGLTALSIALAAVLVALLYFYPEWYVIDTVGVVVAGGSAAIFGISFGLLPSLVLLTGFAIYDAIAVYRTKHMLDLADSVLELRLPIMFVVPKERGYSFLKEEKRIQDRVEDPEGRDAMFMGLGDAVIPAVLVVSALTFLGTYTASSSSVLGLAPPLAVALATLLGSLVGYFALMRFVLRGNPQAGLPLLNGGALVGFFASLLPLYGLAPLLAPLGLGG